MGVWTRLGWIRLACGALLGTAVQLQQGALWPWSTYVAVGSAALALLACWLGLTRRKGAESGAEKEAEGAVGSKFALCAWADWCLGALFASSLAFAAVGLRAGNMAESALNPGLEGRDIDVVGVIAQMPQRNPNGLRFRLNVESAALDGAKLVLPPVIDVGWYGGFSRTEGGLVELQRQAAASGGELQAGERWQLRVRLKAPHGTRNPHGFDYELWAWEQGIQAGGYVRATANDPAPRMLGLQRVWQNPGYALERSRQRVREAIFAAVPDARQAGLIAALVVGDQRAIERADWDVYRATGVAHLMSISGLHVTMFAWGCGVLLAWLWRFSVTFTPRLCLAVPAHVAGSVGGLLAALAYALFSGFGLPAQRTVLMLATVVLLRLGAQRLPWPQVWLLACAAVVAVDPWALLQAGFWLSFVAVGVLFASAVPTGNGQEEYLKNRANYDRGYWTYALKARQKLFAAGREQVLITLALAPLSLLFFQQVSVVGLLANALAIPWVTLVLTPLAMGGAVFAPLWEAASLSVAALNAVLKPLAELPWASPSVAAVPWALGAAAVLGGAFMALRLPWSVRLLGLPPIVAVLLWQPFRPAQAEFAVTAIDIGQGNAVLVQTAKHSLLYDAGPLYSAESDAGHRVIVPLLRAYGEKLDTLMLSHRDADHTGGAAAVLAMQPKAALVSSLEAGHPLLALRPLGTAGSAQRCHAGQRWQWDGVDFTVLHPKAADYDQGLKSNAMSCVLRISNGRQTALLAGDIEAPQELALVAEATKTSATGQDAFTPQLKADLLLASHHGSKTSSTEEWLAAVAPSTVLVQAGYRNRYGHPSEQVMARFTARGIAVVSSAACGAATWQSSNAGGGLAAGQVVCEREQSPRYWQHRLMP